MDFTYTTKYIDLTVVPLGGPLILDLVLVDDAHANWVRVDVYPLFLCCYFIKLLHFLQELCSILNHCVICFHHPRGEDSCTTQALYAVQNSAFYNINRHNDGLVDNEHVG